MNKIVVLDACVLYAAHLRDFLLYLAQQKLFKPRWSDQINYEWIRNVLKNRPDLTAKSFDRVRFMMNDAFPRANVKGYEHLYKGLNLPVVDDVHVLAAAIKSDANFIVTFNIKDFPSNELTKHGIEAVHPDDFLITLIEKSPIKATQAFINQVEHLKNPPVTAAEILEKFRKTNLKNTANRLENLLLQV